MTSTISDTELGFDLGPTKTYKGGRYAGWTRTAPDEGVLRIALQKTFGGKVEEDTYAVHEEHTGTPGVREFLLLNTTDAEQPDVYKVVVGRFPSCTCTGHQTLRAELRCKHYAAMCAVVESQTHPESSHD